MPASLIALTANRWLVVLLADLAAHDGARFVELLHRLGLSRDSLTRTLTAATAHGWVMRNPGHGHPMRPEYVLTDAGRAAAGQAGRIAAAVDRLRIESDRLTRWSMPLVVGVAAGHDRFNALSRLLAPATPRALSQGLSALGEQYLMRRQVVDGAPPSTRYALTARGVALAAALAATR